MTGSDCFMAGSASRRSGAMMVGKFRIRSTIREAWIMSEEFAETLPGNWVPNHSQVLFTM